MARLIVDILDYWHCGAGRGRGVGADAVCVRDRLGLPYLPGRTLKGLLRDAVRRAPPLKTVSTMTQEQLVTALFGSDGYAPPSGNEDPTPIEGTSRGGLRLSDARLPQATLAYLATQHDEERKGLSAQLFSLIAQTAVDPMRGVAKGGSLRTTEVAVPVKLEAEIEWVPTGEASSDVDWQGVISDALPMIMAIGAYRSRGFGRATLCLKEA